LSANDLRGCIGEYWHGNEPSHHVVYLYCYAGQPWKAAERLHLVVTTQYGSQPGSLCGNDDCGQMSAWYMFTCLGFIRSVPRAIITSSVRPASQSRAESFQRKKIHNDAENILNQNIYVQSIKLNGKNWDSPFLPYKN